MAATIVQFPAPSGLTITAYLRKYGTSTWINNSGHSATEVNINSIGTGDYRVTISESALSWHKIYLVSSAATTKAFANYDAYLQDDTNVYIAGDKDQQLIFTTQTLSVSPLSGNLIANTSTFLEMLDYANLTAAEQSAIDALISAASEYIEEQLCYRKFLAADYTDEKQDGNGWDSIFVKNIPLNSIVDIDLITYNAVTGDTETTTYGTAKFSSNTKTGEIRFKPDVQLETAKIFPEGFQNIHISYNGGYASVPQPIQMLCADFVIQMYNDEELVGALEREKLGDYSYSKGKDFIQHMPFSKKQILSSYKLRKV